MVENSSLEEIARRVSKKPAGRVEDEIQYSQVLLSHPDRGSGGHEPLIPLPGQALVAIGHEPSYFFWRRVYLQICPSVVSSFSLGSGFFGL